MQLERLVRRYLINFKRVYIDALNAGVTSVELATRPVVHHFVCSLITSLRDGVVIHHDIKVGGDIGTPDWRIEDRASFGTYALGDHKDLNRDAPYVLSNNEREQIRRYLEYGRPVFVFDGIEFLFFDSAKSIDDPRRAELVPKPLHLKTEWSELIINPTVEVEFRRLLENPGFRRWSEQELMVQLAHRARNASTLFRDLLSSPPGSGSTEAENKLICSFHELWRLIREHQDPALADRGACADFIAQVLVFGLFFAHTRASIYGNTPSEREASIREFWNTESAIDQARQLRPFRTIAEILEDLIDVDSTLRSWYFETIGLLAHAQYMGCVDEPQDYHRLFEQFFRSFDYETSFDRGVFYTPSVLTSWVARATDRLVRQNFNGKSIVDIAETVIDPCCGTGGFLEAILENSDLTAEQLPCFVGFEILPAPYALAHYRLDRIIVGTPLDSMVRILLTDTLSDHLSSPSEIVSVQGCGFIEEQLEAQRLARPPLKVIIGNPPVTRRVVSRASRSIIAAMLDDFRPPTEFRAARQNIQQALNNEAIRFLRWCAQKLLDSKAGILALVLPGAFAHSVSYMYARRWLLENFEDIHVLLFDKDLRTGVVSDSLFNVRQGRLVLFAVLKSEGPHDGSQIADEVNNRRSHTIRFRDISGLTRSGKEAWLGDPEPHLEEFEVVITESPQELFIPVGPYPRELWNACWPLFDVNGTVGIFHMKCSGVKLAPTSIPFHTDQAMLQRRSQAISESDASGFAQDYAGLIEAWWAGQRKPPRANKLTNDVRNAIGRAVQKFGEICIRYSFRPFSEGWVLWDIDLFEKLQRTPGGGTRFRPEIKAAFSAGAVGIAVAPSPKEIGPTLERFAAFVWYLPDNEMASRQNGMIYCDRYPDQTEDGQICSNISSQYSRLFNGEQPETDSLFYTYAIMSSRVYLENFHSALFHLTNPLFPARIPLAACPHIRTKLVNLGRQIAHCEREDFVVAHSGVQFEWPEGITEFRFIRESLDLSTRVITLEGADGVTARVTGVPTGVMDLRISGHNVLSTWLRERRFVYLRRTFRQNDAIALVNLIGRMAHQQLLLEQVDGLVGNLLDTESIIKPPEVTDVTL